MAAKILANLLVMGGGIMARAFVQACQALAKNILHLSRKPQFEKGLFGDDASKTGVPQEAVQNIKKVSKVMAEAEARQILGVTENTPREEIVQKFNKLFEQNGKNGSFYLQSKVFRAKECLETAYQKKAQGPAD